MACRRDTSEERREANVVLELRTANSVSEADLDARSDEVMDMLIESAGGVALGPAVALNLETCTIKLRFDVLGADDAEIHRRVSEVLEIVKRGTDLALARSYVERSTHEDPALAAA